MTHLLNFDHTYYGLFVIPEHTIFSERELTFTCSRSLYAIARPSVVSNVRAPYSAG